MANIVEIVVQAKDQASGSIDKIAVGLQAAGSAAGATAAQVRVLNEALYRVGEVGVGVVNNLFGSVFDGVGKVLSVFGGLYSGFESIKTTIESPLGQTFFGQLSEAIDEVVSQSQKLSRVAGDFSSVFSEVAAGVSGSSLKKAGSNLATDISEGFSITLKGEIARAFDGLDAIVAKGLDKLENSPKKIAGALGGFANALEPIAGAAEPLGVFQLVEEGVGRSTNAIFELSQKLAFLGLGFQALQGLVQNGPFDLLIGQNVRLQEQLLSTQASLVATNKILSDGAQIADPTQAIKALGPAVDQAISKIRKDSLELVGVTSKDLVDLFQIVAGQASNIGANLDQSANIVTSTAAALGTLGVPLFQARQEITSIVQGTIDQNSVLAKNLNINNEMVGKWKAQGTFVDELLKKLEAFKAGNKLASQTIGGITSNIQELFDEIGRSAGAKFLAPIVKELDSVYQFLAANKGVIGEQIENLVDIFATAVGSVIASLKALGEPFLKVFSAVPTYLFKSLANFTKVFADSIGLVVTLFTPALNVFAQLAPYAGALGGIFLALSVGAKTLAFSVGFLDKAFNILAVTLPNVGEALFFIEQRNNGMLNKFSTLTDIVGRGGAGFLLYGENLLKIPGAAGAATGALSKLLGGLAPFAPALTGLIPAFSGIAIKVIGLTQVFPQLVPVLQKVGVLIPNAIRGLSGLAGTSGVFSSLAPLIGQAADKFEGFVTLAGQSERVNELFTASMQAAGGALRDFVVKTAVLGAGAFAGFVFFDQLILKNKGLQKIFQTITETIRNFADTVKEKLAPVFNLLKEVFSFFFQFTKDADGRGGNLFGNVIGGAFLAIAAIRLFGNAISTTFKGFNTAISGFGDNLVASITKIDKARKALLGVTDPDRRVLVNKDDARVSAEIEAAKQERSRLTKEALRLKKESQKDNLPSLQAEKEGLQRLSQSFEDTARDTSKPLSERKDAVRKKRTTDAIIANVDRDILDEPERRKRASDAQKEAVAGAKKITKEISQIDFATPLSEQFKKAFSPITSTLSTAAASVSTFARKLGFDIKFALNDIEAAFRKAFGAIPAIVSGAIGGVKGFVGNQVNNAKFLFNDIEAGIKRLPSTIRGIGSAIASEFKSFAADPSKYLLSTGIAIEATARAYLSKASKAVQGFVSDVKTNAAKLPSLAADAFRSLTSGSGLTALRANLSGFFRTLDLQAGAAWTKFSNFAISSFKTIGKSFLSVASELGPTLLIGGAVAAFTTVLGEIDRQAQLATSGVKSLTEALKTTQDQVNILTKSQATDAFTALNELTAQRKEYVNSVKDESKLKDDPTLKLYDSQIDKLKQLRVLQDTPQASENRLRAKVAEDRDNFGTKFTEGAAFVGDILRGSLNTATFGLTNKIGLGDRAGNLREKEIETIKANSGIVFSGLNDTANEAKSKQGLESQKTVIKELIKLEQERTVAESIGNTTRVAQIDFEIERAKQEKDLRLANIDAAIKLAQATQDVDGKQAKTIANLKEARKAIEDVNVSVAPIDLPRIGSAIEQATAKYGAAVDALNKSAGDPALFKAKLTELLETATALQDAGILRADEVAKTFTRIATNVSADRDQQIKAQQAITEAYQKEAQKRIAAIDTQQLQIKALLATGKITGPESIALTSKNEQEKIKAQLEADEKAFQARKTIREKNAEEQKTQIARDRQIAEAQLAAASGDPSKVKALRAKEQPVLDEKIAGTSQELKDAQARQKTLLDLKNSGLGTSATATELEGVNGQVLQLTSRLSSLNDQKGKLDGALKLSTTTQSDLDDVIKQIDTANTELERLKSENAQTTNDFNTVKDSPFVDTSKYRERLKQEQDAIAAQQAKVSELGAKRDQFQSILTANPEQAKSAQSAISDSDKKELDRKKSFQLQTTEDERKQDEARKAAAEKLAIEEAESKVKILDGQIKLTLQAEKVGETQRLAQIAQLRSKGIILESEFKRRETAERKRSIDIELQLEQQKRKEIEKLKKQGKGPSQEIENANLIKLGELTKNKADVEGQFIGEIVAELRDRLTIESQKYAVTIEQQNLKLERQKLLYNALEKGLENQNRLAESANKLGQSMIALKESEFNALNKIFDRQQAAIRKAGGEGNFADLELEEKKLILAEKLAVLKLNALKQQQKFEAESLEREIQKNDLVLKRKKDENEIAIAKKKIDIAAQDVAIKSAELEVKLRPQSEEAKLKLAQAKLGQDKNFLELGGLQQEKGFIGDEARVNDLVNNNKRRDLANTQEGQTNSALGELIAATRDPAKQEELQARLLTRLTGSSEGESSALTTTDIEAAFNAGAQSVSVRGASFKKPTSALLGQVEQNNTFTAAPAPKPDNTPFATSFEELARKYPDKGGVGSFDELNRKYPDKAAASFDELNKKYAEAEVKPEQAIVSSFDKLSKEIDQGFANVLVAPDLKVKELTAGLEAEFERVSKKITENPVKLTIDEDRLKQVQKDLSKPLAVFDEKQLERLEGIVGALGKGETNIANSKLVGAAAGGNITINAPTTINEAQQKAGNSREEFVNVFNDILKKVGQVTAGVK